MLELVLDKTNAMEFQSWISDGIEYPMGSKYPYVDGCFYIVNSLSIEKESAIFYADIIKSVFLDGKEVNANLSNLEIMKVDWVETGEHLRIAISYPDAAWALNPVVIFLVEIMLDWNENENKILEYINAETNKYHLQADIQTLRTKIKPIGVRTQSVFAMRLARDINTKTTLSSSNKPKRPNGQIHQRAMIWRDLLAWIKLGSVTPTPKECIAELKNKPAYKNKIISTKRMQKILDEGFAGAYKDILKNI